MRSTSQVLWSGSWTYKTIKKLDVLLYTIVSFVDDLILKDHYFDDLFLCQNTFQCQSRFNGTDSTTMPLENIRRSALFL